MKDKIQNQFQADLSEMTNKRQQRTKIGKIKPEILYKHQMEIIEEAWLLFEWKHNEKFKKQIKLTDLMVKDKDNSNFH